MFIILLAQGGEFGFVVFQAAAQGGVIAPAMASLLVAAVAISMLLTPLLLVAADRWWIPRLARGKRSDIAEISEPQNASVIIAGFGRYGQIVSRMLYANGIQPTVLDHDAEQIEALRRFGWRVYYGDATRLDLLRTAGAATARVFVLAIDDVEQSVRVAALVREHFPHLQIVARARNVQHYFKLRELGITMIERETLDSSLMSARSVLGLLGGSRTTRARWRCAFGGTASDSWWRWRRTGTTSAFHRDGEAGPPATGRTVRAGTPERQAQPARGLERQAAGP